MDLRRFPFWIIFMKSKWIRYNRIFHTYYLSLLFIKIFIMYVLQDSLYIRGIIKMDKKIPNREKKVTEEYEVERGIYKLNSPIFVTSVHPVKSTVKYRTYWFTMFTLIILLLTNFYAFQVGRVKGIWGLKGWSTVVVG